MYSDYANVFYFLHQVMLVKVDCNASVIFEVLLNLRGKLPYEILGFLTYEIWLIKDKYVQIKEDP